MSFPYLDGPGYKRRTVIPFQYIDAVEQAQPGFTGQLIATWTSQINSRLRKRYGNSCNVNHLPLGQVAPPLVPSGMNPPPVSLVGRPTLGSMQIQLYITGGGAVGTATFKASYDGGLTFPIVGTTAPTFVFNSSNFVTGLTVQFPVGTYDTSNVYMAATPVPETVLQWLVALINPDMMRRHGIQTTDPQMVILMDDKKRALDEIAEAANTNTGLYDLPINEDLDTAISSGGPRSYSEQSPYAWSYKQESAAQRGLDAILNPNKLIGS